jgi:hypothetical protein
MAAISISLLLTGPGKVSIEQNILKREVFPTRKAINQQTTENSRY